MKPFTLFRKRQRIYQEAQQKLQRIDQPQNKAIPKKQKLMGQDDAFLFI